MPEIGPRDYREQFGIDDPGEPQALKAERLGKALEYALDIRKFEIDLYWKRAAYFWTFIAAALAAYGVIQGSKDIADRGHLTVLVCCLGLVFSFAWYCVNRGSKRYQQNWENHVDLLEDEVIGPLYKTWLATSDQTRDDGRPAPIGALRAVLTDSADFSVTKVNQIVSVAVVTFWLLLLGASVWPTLSLALRPDFFVVGSIGVAVGACALIWRWGRTSRSAQTDLGAFVRDVGIVSPSKKAPAAVRVEVGGMDRDTGSSADAGETARGERLDADGGRLPERSKKQLHR